MNKVLTVTARGAILMPAELRRVLGVADGGQLLAEITADGLLLRSVTNLAVEIYDDARIHEFDEAEADLASIQSGGGRRQ